MYAPRLQLLRFFPVGFAYFINLFTLKFKRPKTEMISFILHFTFCISDLWDGCVQCASDVNAWWQFFRTLIRHTILFPLRWTHRHTVSMQMNQTKKNRISFFTLIGTREYIIHVLTLFSRSHSATSLITSSHFFCQNVSKRNRYVHEWFGTSLWAPHINSDSINKFDSERNFQTHAAEHNTNT